MKGHVWRWSKLAAGADDELIMKYLDGEELTIDEVRHGLHVGVKNCAITPVYCGTATGGIGLEWLMQAIRRYVPAPNEHEVMATHQGEGTALDNNVAGPVAAAVFKTIIDRYVGRISYLRVNSGKVTKDAQLMPTGKTSRIASLSGVRGQGPACS